MPPSHPRRPRQFTPATLDGFVTWAEHAAGKIRSQTKVASTYYSLELKSHMSAELLKTAEAPMVRRLRAMGEQGPLGGAWRRYMRCMLEFEDPTLARKVRVRPLWEDPNTRIESAAVDAFGKAVAGGIGIEGFQRCAQLVHQLAIQRIQLFRAVQRDDADFVGFCAHRDVLVTHVCLRGEFG